MEENVDAESIARALGWFPPSRRKPLLQGTPRLWQYYWVDFHTDAYPPEFTGNHPGIVVRAARRLSDTCVVVPVTSTPQANAVHIHQLARNPNPRSPDVEAWVVCDHLYTVNVARLRPCQGKFGNNLYPRVGEQDRIGITTAIRSAMPLFGG